MKTETIDETMTEEVSAPHTDMPELDILINTLGKEPVTVMLIKGQRNRAINIWGKNVMMMRDTGKPFTLTDLKESGFHDIGYDRMREPESMQSMKDNAIHFYNILHKDYNSRLFSFYYLYLAYALDNLSFQTRKMLAYTAQSNDRFENNITYLFTNHGILRNRKTNKLLVYVETLDKFNNPAKLPLNVLDFP